MASKTTLNAKNLETLGAERLAELLIEISTGSAVAKRRLRLELAGAQSPKEAGREVAKRLTSIARSNRTKSTVRVRVEHTFGAQTNETGGTIVRTISLVRAKAGIGIKNLVCNMRRLGQLRRLNPCPA